MWTRWREHIWGDEGVGEAWKLLRVRSSSQFGTERNHGTPNEYVIELSLGSAKGKLPIVDRIAKSTIATDRRGCFMHCDEWYWANVWMDVTFGSFYRVSRIRALEANVSKVKTFDTPQKISHFLPNIILRFIIFLFPSYIWTLFLILPFLNILLGDPRGHPTSFPHWIRLADQCLRGLGFSNQWTFLHFSENSYILCRSIEHGNNDDERHIEGNSFRTIHFLKQKEVATWKF